MSKIIHCKQTEKGLRYRVWSTIVDAYLTRPMGEKGLRSWLLACALDDWRHETDKRIERANRTGSSSPDRSGVDAPWFTERCGACGNFHEGICPKESP